MYIHDKLIWLVILWYVLSINNEHRNNIIFLNLSLWKTLYINNYNYTMWLYTNTIELTQILFIYIELPFDNFLLWKNFHLVFKWTITSCKGVYINMNSLVHIDTIITLCICTKKLRSYTQIPFISIEWTSHKDLF